MLAFLTVLSGCTWLSLCLCTTRTGLLTCADSSCPAGGAALPLRMRIASCFSRREPEAGVAFPCWLQRIWRRPPVTARSDTAVARGPRREPVTERGAEREAAGSEVSAARGRPGGPSGLGLWEPGGCRSAAALHRGPICTCAPVPGPALLSGTSVSCCNRALRDLGSPREALHFASPGPVASTASPEWVGRGVEGSSGTTDSERWEMHEGGNSVQF